MSDQYVVENFKYSQFMLKDGENPTWRVTFRGNDLHEVSLQNATTGNYFAWDSGNEAITQANEPYWWHVPKGPTPDDVYMLQVKLYGEYVNLALKYNPNPELGLETGQGGDEAKWRFVPA
ncbi:hypothetical protein DEU56DRAFT_760100 [Suillus clintonianus]|uniref:uncharacterized protein n=1 Tax=Suillus clintonianus TaxID=1904413 RepID=UPI001B879BC5|nr:uncharacterized protein DEU56DRAFT_760100 [Suillus clintonianus]KAG2123287.1 hypothetical protein DEU56DRAFT_760100 [Suillus clintonianus]